MSHIIVGIDVHKKMLAVVVADVAQEGSWSFQRRRFVATPEDLRLLAAFLARPGGAGSSDGIDGQRSCVTCCRR